MPQHTLYDLDWWRTAADKCPLAVAFVGADGKYGYANGAFSKLLGWSRAELVGKHWAEVTPLTEIGEGQQTERAGRSGELQEVYETKNLITKSGAVLLVAIYAHRMPAHGDYQGWIMFVADATATRESVEHLRAEYLKMQGRIEGIQAESQKCQQACLLEIQRAQRQAEQNAERLNDLTEALIGKPNAGNSEVRIGGDYAGRDKTNTPTVVLVWLVVAAMALGLTAMGAKLIVHGGASPAVTVEP